MKKKERLGGKLLAERREVSCKDIIKATAGGGQLSSGHIQQRPISVARNMKGGKPGVPCKRKKDY